MSAVESLAAGAGADELGAGVNGAVGEHAVKASTPPMMPAAMISFFMVGVFLSMVR